MWLSVWKHSNLFLCTFLPTSHVSSPEEGFNLQILKEHSPPLPHSPPQPLPSSENNSYKRGCHTWNEMVSLTWGRIFFHSERPKSSGDTSPERSGSFICAAKYFLAQNKPAQMINSTEDGKNHRYDPWLLQTRFLWINYTKRKKKKGIKLRCFYVIGATLWNDVNINLKVCVFVV